MKNIVSLKYFVNDCKKKSCFDLLEKSIGLWSACTNFGEPLAINSKVLIKHISLKYQPCQTRPAIANINSNKTLFYSFTVSVKKW